MASDLDNYALSSQAQAKKNRELARLAEIVQDLQTDLQSKADKPQVFKVESLSASKADLLELQDICQNMRIDLDSALVMMNELLKTLLPSGDLATKRVKTREELGRTLHSLIKTSNWTRPRSPGRYTPTTPQLSSLCLPSDQLKLSDKPQYQLRLGSRRLGRRAFKHRTSLADRVDGAS